MPGKYLEAMGVVDPPLPVGSCNRARAGHSPTLVRPVPVTRSAVQRPRCPLPTLARRQRWSPRMRRGSPDDTLYSSSSSRVPGLTSATSYRCVSLTRCQKAHDRAIHVHPCSLKCDLGFLSAPSRTLWSTTLLQPSRLQPVAHGFGAVEWQRHKLWGTSMM